MVLQSLEQAKSKRSLDADTVPSTIGIELEHNPFLRCDGESDAVLSYVRRNSTSAASIKADLIGGNSNDTVSVVATKVRGVEALGRLREAKNAF